MPATRAILAPLALLADLALGDPPSWPHPVRFLGRIINNLEAKAPLRPFPRRVYGLACVAGLSLATWIAVKILAALPLIGFCFALYFAYAGLALGGLLREGRKAARLLNQERLAETREVIGGLVSRDVAGLNAAGLRRTLAETLSENLSDGFCAPFFYFCLGGPALMWFYKCVSTFDSMWGYKTPRFKELGWAGARLDDVLNYIPARLTALFILAAGWLMRLGGLDLFSQVARDAAKCSSPNAGWPMAAAAWSIGASMGGSASYFGRKIEKPWLGPSGKAVNDQDLAKLQKLLFTASLLFASSIWFFCVFL